MTADLAARIRTHLDMVGYSGTEIDRGIAYADEAGYSTADEALSLAVSRIIYSENQLADGARFAVDPGFWE